MGDKEMKAISDAPYRNAHAPTGPIVPGADLNEPFTMIRRTMGRNNLHGFLRLALLIVPLVFSAGCYSTVAGDGENARAIGPAVCSPELSADVLARQVLDLVNLERAAANMALQPVTLDFVLSNVADEYACRMIEQGFFDHVDPETGYGPGDRAMAGSYRYYAVGENLAAGPISAAAAFDLWMESDSHREIILDPQWTEMGLAVKLGGDYGTCWVQMFGAPADDF